AGETCQRRYSFTPQDKLQWSPGFSAGETREIGRPRRAPRPASMEPRLQRRGNQILSRKAARTLDASMEPRLQRRGNCVLVLSSSWRDSLQWCPRFSAGEPRPDVATSRAPRAVRSSPGVSAGETSGEVKRPDESGLICGIAV